MSYILALIFILSGCRVPTFVPPSQPPVEDPQMVRAEAQAQKVFKSHHIELKHADLVAKYALKHHIPARLLAAVIFVESTGRSDVISRSGDVGLMQINARIWHRSKAELLNPERNLEIGSRILGAYIHQYGWREGIHAYNGFDKPTDAYVGRVYQAAGMQVPERT